MINAVIKQESGFNPKAVSSAGAVGMMQLMPATAKGLGVTNSYDATQNINGGAKYLAQLYKQFGNWNEALASYYAGAGNVKKYGWQKYSKYVNSVLSHYSKYGGS